MAIRFIWLCFGVLLLLAGCGGCEQKDTYTGDPNPLWKVHKVYGRVKTVRIEHFEALPREGKLVPGSQVGENYTWDSMDARGNLLISRVFAIGGGLMKTEQFTYNPENQIIAITTLNGNGDETIHQDVYYNDKGQKIKQVVTLHLPDGDQAYWRTWEFDSIGQLVESFVYRSDTTIDNRETLTYYEGDSGKVHVHSLFVGYDSLKYRNEYIYSSLGYDSILHRYRPLNAAGDSVGYQSRYEYTHNEQGLELTRKLVSPEGQVRAHTEYQYTFDHHNNWTQRIEIVDGEPTVIKVRTFTYYDE